MKIINNYKIHYLNLILPLNALVVICKRTTIYLLLLNLLSNIFEKSIKIKELVKTINFLFLLQLTSSKIWEVARNYRESSKWSIWSIWGWRINYFGKNKCNLFVYDVLTEAGAKAPNRKFVSLNSYTYLVNCFEFVMQQCNYFFQITPLKTNCIDVLKYSIK